MSRSTARTPPPFCQYPGSACDHSFKECRETYAFFVYASNPPEVANTIRDTIRSLNSYTSGRRDYQGWEDLPNAGQVIFCEICKAIRHSRLVVADITTLNFNVLFEVGYAYGLGLPVLPVRDLTYERDSKLIQQIGVFDTVAYESYSNSQQLGGVVQRHAEHRPYELLDPAIDTQRPLYLLKSPHDTEISVALGGVLRARYEITEAFASRGRSPEVCAPRL